MLGWLSRLFGATGSPRATSQPVPLLSLEYQGYQIHAEPQAEGGQFRLAGRICRQIDGEEKQHLFIRADLFTDQQQAAQLMVDKAKIAIDQQGDDLFLPPPGM